MLQRERALFFCSSSLNPFFCSSSTKPFLNVIIHLTNRPVNSRLEELCAGMWNSSTGTSRLMNYTLQVYPPLALPNLHSLGAKKSQAAWLDKYQKGMKKRIKFWMDCCCSVAIMLWCFLFFFSVVGNNSTLINRLGVVRFSRSFQQLPPHNTIKSFLFFDRLNLRGGWHCTLLPFSNKYTFTWQTESDQLFFVYYFTRQIYIKKNNPFLCVICWFVSN